MKRREFLSVVGGAVVIPITLPPAAGAQQGESVRVVGLLDPSDAEWRRRGLLLGLEKLGYREGQNTAMEVRSADGKLERLPSLASELVRANVDVIVALNTPGTQAAIDTKTRIPIVMALGRRPGWLRVRTQSEPSGRFGYRCFKRCGPDRRKAAGGPEASSPRRTAYCRFHTSQRSRSDTSASRG